MNQNVECQIETPEYKKEIWFLVNDFLKAQEIQWANDIKEILRSKITETCNIQEIQDLRDDFSEKWQNLTGKEKFKMYELSAMLSNYLKEIRANPQLQTQRVPQPLWGDVYGWLDWLWEQKEIVQSSEYFLQWWKMQDRSRLFTLNKNLTKVQDLGNNSFQIKYYFEYFGTPREWVVLVYLQPNWEHTVTNEFWDNMQIKYGNRRNISLWWGGNEYPQETRIQQYNQADKEYLSTQVRFFTARQEEVTLDFAKKKENVQNVIHNY